MAQTPDEILEEKRAELAEIEAQMQAMTRARLGQQLEEDDVVYSRERALELKQMQIIKADEVTEAILNRDAASVTTVAGDRAYSGREDRRNRG